MSFYAKDSLLEGQVRIPSGCAISGLISRKGRKISGQCMVDSIKTMHQRSNGLGGGYAGYGIYPKHRDSYAFHVFYEDREAQRECERYLDENFELDYLSKMPVRKTPKIIDEPIIWRYFLVPSHGRLWDTQLDEREFVCRAVIHINTCISGAYVFSSGKNMGIFKAVGYPEDVGFFYQIEDYEAYAWTVHGRYPTNTPGWWGGSHPFGLLDISVVHNGEISSYDANRRFIEMFGYKCSLQTDTEVFAYIFDYLTRKQGLSMLEASHVIAAPFWTTINHFDKELKDEYMFLRNNFSSLLVTGPFSIIVGFEGGLMALNDRLKLRSLVAARKDDLTLFSSEEVGIRAVVSDPDELWYPSGGKAEIAMLEEAEA